MASAKEIRGQIKATQNTAKITKAMEMVAASKMRKAQERVLDARSYAEGIERVIHNLMRSHPEYKHPFLVKRDVKRMGVIAVSTDKGLCGGLNTNAMKKVLSLMESAPVDVDFMNIGRRASQFMRRFGGKVLASVEDVNDAPSLDEILGVVQVAMDKYMAGELDEVHLVYSQYVNTMTQKPTSMRLLPCDDSNVSEQETYWDYLYEPDSQVVLDGLLRRYIEALVYHSVLENKACEHSARMVAMKSATDNARDIVKDLQVTYNKARQAAITQEIAEICSGAAASA
ncbi:MAG: F0F1 ATP synthase subunit gamma [Zetaproteobacteria bacterium]|nr:F0F1 ATP synthase subunit gamma [Zetaproteobacteria bacterium]